MSKLKIHSGQMEVAVANLIGYRTHTIVPNVSWGLGLRHECDMLVLDDKDRFTEIEIKVSKSDLKADFNKGHGHYSGIITRLIYAVPTDLLETAKELVPPKCGIIEVLTIPPKDKTWLPVHRAQWIRRCRHRKPDRPVTDETIRKFMMLGCMRIWSLKTCLYRKK